MPITDPDWTAPIEMTFDPNRPIRSNQGNMLAGNPIAMALMKPGSPVILANWHPYNMVTAEDGATGEIWSHAVDGAVATIETPGFVDGFEYQLICDELSGTAEADFRVGLFLATSAAYIDVAVALAVNIVHARSIQATIHRPRDISRSHSLEYIGWTWNGTSSDTTGGMNAFSIQNSTAQKIGKARVSVSTGEFDAGRVRLFRRKLYG
jgi:hypothetical protein